ncbi:MAG: class I SAM-dependent methyltransferase [Jiangellales bacterium]
MTPAPRYDEGTMDEQFSAAELATRTGRPLEWILDRPDVASRLRREPPDRVLVLGCEDGREVVDLAAAFPNITVYGIDDDQAKVEEASTRFHRSSVRDRVLCQWGSPTYPRMAANFDLVIAVGVLTRPDHPVDTTDTQMLGVLARLLGDEGLAILDTCAPLSVEDAKDAGFYRIELVGQSQHTCPAYLLRR